MGLNFRLPYVAEHTPTVTKVAHLTHKSGYKHLPERVVRLLQIGAVGSAGRALRTPAVYWSSAERAPLSSRRPSTSGSSSSARVSCSSRCSLTWAAPC
jgi:hypothetical protein